jgi:hypothetical protein
MLSKESKLEFLLIKVSTMLEGENWKALFITKEKKKIKAGKLLSQGRGSSLLLASSPR